MLDKSTSSSDELANAPVSIASGSTDEWSGIPWLVDGVSWEGGPLSSITCWEDDPAGSGLMAHHHWCGSQMAKEAVNGTDVVNTPVAYNSRSPSVNS